MACHTPPLQKAKKLAANAIIPILSPIPSPNYKDGMRLRMGRYNGISLVYSLFQGVEYDRPSLNLSQFFFLRYVAGSSWGTTHGRLPQAKQDV